LKCGCFPSQKQSPTAGRFFPRRRNAGESLLGNIDGLIAAAALEHDLTLLTRNVKDFAGVEVPLFNPWEA
jgi:predicted nucleic acid-binding protein